MKNLILLCTCLFLLFAASLLHAQDKIAINFCPGIFISNSENSIIGFQDANLRFIFAAGISYQKDNILGGSLQLEYSFIRSGKDRLLEFIAVSPTDAVYSIWATYTLIQHNIDYAYVKKLDNNFSIGGGPSFSILNRTLYYKDPNYSLSLNDMLASSCLGINAFIEYSTFFNNENNGFFFSSKIKLRYVHSIWFDKGIRDLDNYNQQFLTAQL